MFCLLIIQNLFVPINKSLMYLVSNFVFRTKFFVSKNTLSSCFATFNIFWRCIHSLKTKIIVQKIKLLMRWVLSLFSSVRKWKAYTKMCKLLIVIKRFVRTKFTTNFILFSFSKSLFKVPNIKLTQFHHYNARILERS